MRRLRGGTLVAGAAVLLAVVTIVAAVRVLTAPRRDPANVVLVVVDALRRDHVGTYGHHVPTTPFLDELAARGAVFENAWSHAPQTFNATAALLTGQVAPLLLERADAPSRPEGAALRNALAAENRTLAETLASAGYDTIAVFTNPHHDESSGFAQGFARWRYLLPSHAEDVYAGAPDVEAAFRDLAGQLDPERPFFAYVHYMDVHNPYVPPKALAERFVRTRGTDRYRNGRPEGPDVPSDDDLRFMMESYDACIRSVDDSLRTLVAIASGSARGRDTVFIVTADHGDEFMDHGGLGHGHSMYPELLRVPLVVVGDGIPAGRRVPGLVRGIDVAATIAALAALRRPPGMEGHALLSDIDRAGDTAPAPVPETGRAVRVHLRSDDAFSFAWNAHLRSITTDDLHLLADPSAPTWEMYDMRGDRRAQHDLFGRGDRAVRRMRRKLEEYERHLREVELRSDELSARGPAAAVSEPVARQLRALGYAE